MGERKEFTKSYLSGVIALIFLIIGYQTALFVHRAAVISIADRRDHPDTVFVVGTPVQDRKPMRFSESEISNTRTPHSPIVGKVRKKVPFKEAETFDFDPNTVTVEDLCRLGFSVKQAESIDNYRNKGGRFHRKSDFAKSYVVSDSIYKRLEPYIVIPKLDLNLADSASLDNLPGIGGWYASAIIRHRTLLGGFSNTCQLMDIKGFDESKYRKLEGLIDVNPANVKAYPLWTLPADSLVRHPYIKSFSVAKAIVLYRKNNPSDRLTVKGLLESGIIDADCAGKLSLCLLE